MKKIALAGLLLLLFLGKGEAQVSLTKISANSFTPNATDTIGAFARIYYHSTRKKFFLVYAARYFGQTNPSGVLNSYRWMELDTNLVATGNKGTLSGLTGAGDFAMVLVDSSFYHLSVGGSGAVDYKLNKYNSDFVLKGTKIIDINTCESNIDQEMNYTNGRLIIGAMYDANFCPPTNPPDTAFHSYTRVYQYDTNLNEIKSPILLDTPSKVTWGASMIYRNNYYYEITMEHFNNRDLYAYKYDTNFVYQSRKLLHSDGQWSQGVLWDGSYYYVAHHTLNPNHGNVLLSVYDSSWNIITTANVTTYVTPSESGPPISSFNANRPYIIKVGSKIYISYDVESYILNANQKDWQAHVDVYQIGSTLPTTFLNVGVVLKKDLKAEISWQTVDEKNCKEYWLQRSEDGIKFYNHEKIDAKNAITNSYSILNDVSFLSVSKVYYRIVAVDKDGTKTYSKTVAVVINRNEAISVFPNPAKDKIYFSGTEDIEGKTVEIIETTGKLIAKKKVEKNSINLPLLVKGIYLVNLKLKDKNFVQRLIIE